MAEITLQEYLSTAQRGMLSRLFGPEFMLKQQYLVAENIFTETFGRRVWDSMNNRTVLYNAIRKTGWGPTFGWRLRTDRGGGNQRAVSETGSLPTIDVSNYVNVGSPPKFPATTFGVAIKAQFMGGLEGGIGDALAVEQEAKMRDHIKLINQQLTKGNFAYNTTTYDSSPTKVPAGIPGAGAACEGFYVVNPVAAAAFFSIGCTVGMVESGTGNVEDDGSSPANVCTVVGYDPSNGKVYTDYALNLTAGDGDVLYVLDRVSPITSVFDVPMEAAMMVCGVSVAGVETDVFNLEARTAGTYLAGAKVDHNSGVGRDINLKLMDDSLDAIRENGGLMGLGLILTGHSQYSSFDRLLQAQQRYLGYGTFQFGVGDERTYPGTQVGMELASYRGLPILPDADVPKGVSSTGAALGHDVLILDLDHLEIAVAIATQYFENRNYFVAEALVVQGLMFTALELRARRVDVHARITDLNA